VRWQHPQRGLLGPGEFIPLAEDSELIHPLTDYVLEAALDQHDRWRDEGVVLPLAVNVATQCLLADTFADRVAAALARHRAEPGHLTLEITESALIADPDRAAAVLATLRQLGVRLSIDDFGTGYASMAYLQRIPLDELKIDRCFITTLQSSHGNQAIVRAGLELAHALVGDVGAAHRGQRRRVDGLPLADGHRPGGLVVVPAGDDALGIGHDRAVVKEHVDVVLGGQQRADVAL